MRPRVSGARQFWLSEKLAGFGDSLHSCAMPNKQIVVTLPSSAWVLLQVAALSSGPFARGPAAAAWLRDTRAAARLLAAGKAVTVEEVRGGIRGLGTVQRYAADHSDREQLAACEERAELLEQAIRLAGVEP